MVPAGFPGRGEGFVPLPGGSPYNTAIAIGRLGVPVKFFGKFSSDFFGEILQKRLRENHVGGELLILSELNSTLAFVKLDKGREPQYIFFTEGAADRSLGINDLPKRLPADTRCICFGSIAMTMEPVASAIEALIVRENALQGQGKWAPVISFDPNIRPFMIKDKKSYIGRMEKWVAASTITKISASDFEFIYPGLDPEKALHKILAMGPRLVISTLGSRGAVALLRRNDGNYARVEAPGIEVPVKDTIGAGDSFHGAFLSWLELKGKMSRPSLASLTEAELYDALYFANKAASLVCSRQGADPPTLREIQALKPKEKPAKTASKPKAAEKKPSGPVKKTASKTKVSSKPGAQNEKNTKPRAAAKPAKSAEAKPGSAKTVKGKTPAVQSSRANSSKKK